MIHTLPVTKNQLLLSKYLSALITIFISVSVCILDLILVLYTPEFFETLKTLINVSVTGFNMSGGMFVFILCTIMFFQVCAMISMAFSAIVKANTYNQGRTSKGFIWFFIYYLLAMYVTLLVAVVVFGVSGNLDNLFATVLPQSMFITILVIGIICYFLYSIIFYFLAKRMFEKGVNVD